MLDGIDDIDWAALSHNYGSAENIPGLLKAAARGEPAANANDSLDNQLYHQGGWVCSAATAALPYLLDLIESPVAAERVEHVELIAHLAREAAWVGPEHVDEGWPFAWAAAFPRVLRLLDDPAEDVRRSAVWALGNSPRQAPEAVAALRARFDREPAAIVRTDVLDALEELGDEEWIRGLDGHADPAIAVNAMLKTHTRNGSTVEAGELATVLAALRGTDDLEVYRPILSAATHALTPADYTAVVAVLAGHADASARLAAVRLANLILAEHRGRDERLIALLTPLLEESEIRLKVLQVLAAIAAPVQDAYARLLDDPAVADAALWALVRTGDARCVAPLREQVATGGRHSRVHDSSPHVWSLPSLGEMLEQVPDAFVPELLPALRDKLAYGSQEARLDYLNTLVAWGTRAEEARPEVEALDGTEADQLARQALDAIAPSRPEPPEVAELSAADLWRRTRAAHRLWRATGERAEAARVLIGVVEEVLDGPQALPAGRAAIAHLAAMGAAEAEGLARRVLAEDRRLRYFGGWRVFTEDEAWRRAAERILEA